MTYLIAAATLLAAGYALGRWQPLRRLSDWANWQRWGRRPTGLRRAAVWTVLTAENLAWMAVHPRQTYRAWRDRNTPPEPPRPMVVRDLTGSHGGEQP